MLLVCAGVGLAQQDLPKGAHVSHQLLLLCFASTTLEWSVLLILFLHPFKHSFCPLHTFCPLHSHQSREGALLWRIELEDIMST